ncbi:MAG TPA: hypothetical protein VFM46_14625 [Pseudomonadales bacterium]|nr:hypothetical protein [Pseudomonadales bacterium]
MIHVYQENEHPSGFVGIRVAVKVGADYRQQYFNFWDRAKGKWISKAEQSRLLKQARELEAGWKQASAELLRKARLQPKCTRTAKRQIAFGFTYQLKIEKKNRRGKTEVFIYPAFSVFMTEQKRYRVFYISKDKGAAETFKEALNAYSKLRALSPAEKRSIKPPSAEEWKAARRELTKTGHEFPMARMREYGLI